MAEEAKLPVLKEQYSELQKKYDLPSFEDMNKDFYIEKLAEMESDLLIREIRKFVADRLYNYLRFIESLLNPQNVPIWVFSVIKTLNTDDKKKLEDVYKKMSNNEVNLIELDIDYNEEKEVEFIKNSYSLWQEVKKEMLGIMRIVKENLNKEKQKDSRGYFG
jgi:hypothetical protein